MLFFNNVIFFLSNTFLSYTVTEPYHRMKRCFKDWTTQQSSMSAVRICFQFLYNWLDVLSYKVYLINMFNIYVHNNVINQHMYKYKYLRYSNVWKKCFWKYSTFAEKSSIIKIFNNIKLSSFCSYCIWTI